MDENSERIESFLVRWRSAAVGESESTFVERLVGVDVVEAVTRLRLDGVDGSGLISTVAELLGLRLLVGGGASIAEAGPEDNEDNEETECERARFDEGRISSSTFGTLVLLDMSK